jgi:hypothetical protein
LARQALRDRNGGSSLGDTDRTDAEMTGR